MKDPVNGVFSTSLHVQNLFRRSQFRRSRSPRTPISFSLRLSRASHRAQWRPFGVRQLPGFPLRWTLLMICYHVSIDLQLLKQKVHNHL